MGNSPAPSLELEQTQLALRIVSELNQIKTGIFAQTVHELRSPLSSLMSLLQLILNDLCEDPKEEREFLQQAYGAANRLMGIIDELANISKVTSGAIALDLRPVEMTALLDEVYSLVHLQAANRNIRLTFTASDRLLYCLVDEGKLIAVMMMLLDSAIRHQEGGHLILSLDPEIGLTVQMPFNDCWQRSVSLPPLPNPLSPTTLEAWSREIHLSAGLQWQLAQTLISGMGGTLSHEGIVQDGVIESQWQLHLPIVEQ